jgi:hypothetical protein
MILQSRIECSTKLRLVISEPLQPVLVSHCPRINQVLLEETAGSEYSAEVVWVLVEMICVEARLGEPLLQLKETHVPVPSMTARWEEPDIMKCCISRIGVIEVPQWTIMSMQDNVLGAAALCAITPGKNDCHLVCSRLIVLSRVMRGVKRNGKGN